MTTLPRPPPLPKTARPSRTADVPSHAQFLLNQIRASWDHLHKSKALDLETYTQIDEKLSQVALLSPDNTSNSMKQELVKGEDESEEARLGKRNAWFRKAMTETDVLPNIVEVALNTVAGPFLGSTSIDSIVELVSLSQKSIAEAVTDPERQRVASTSALVGLKGAQTGVARGLAAANTSLSEMGRKREETRLKAQQKKEEMREQKQLAKELKEERHEIKERLANARSEGARRQGGHSALAISPASSYIVAEHPSEQMADPCPTCGRSGGQSKRGDRDTLASSDASGASLGAGEITPSRNKMAEAVSASLPDASCHTPSNQSSPRDISAPVHANTGGGAPSPRRHEKARSKSELAYEGEKKPQGSVGATDQDEFKVPSKNIHEQSEQRDRHEESLPFAPPSTSHMVSDADERGPHTSSYDYEQRSMNHPLLASPRSEERPELQAREQRGGSPQPCGGTTSMAYSQSALLRTTPPPQHHLRPGMGGSRLTEADRVPDLSAATDARPLQGDEGRMVDVTDRKRKGWKSRLLG